MIDYNELARYNIALAEQFGLDNSIEFLLNRIDNHQAFKLLVTEALVKPFLIEDTLLGEIKHVMENTEHLRVFTPLLEDVSPVSPNHIHGMYIYSALSSLYYASVVTKEYNFFCNDASST